MENSAKNNIPMNKTTAPPLPPGTARTWVPRPPRILGCPPGLEYLTQIDSLHVEQVPSFVEAFTGWETNNKYLIRNSAGLQVYYAAEDTDTCMRICCGSQRRFEIFILDNLNARVIKITRAFKCCAGCCWCAGCCERCAHEVAIEAPAGTVIGYVRQTGSKWKPHYEVLDDSRMSVIKIEGPCCILDGPCCPFDNEFKIMTLDSSSQIGKITKKYAGVLNEMVTKADRFSLHFPIDMHVKTKATLMGALFLIDFMFFETNSNNNTIVPVVT